MNAWADRAALKQTTELAKRLLMHWWSAQSVCVVMDSDHFIEASTTYRDGLRIVVTMDELRALGVI